MRIPIRRIGEFILANALGTLVDTAVLWIFASFILDGSYLGENIISPVISFEAAVLTNFLCSYSVIWRDRITCRGKKSFFRHYIPYNLSCTGVFFFRLGLLVLAKEITGVHVVLCNLMAMCVTGLLNFLLGDKLIFRKAPAPIVSDENCGDDGE